jgi:hypothetical protein
MGLFIKEIIHAITIVLVPFLLVDHLIAHLVGRTRLGYRSSCIIGQVLLSMRAYYLYEKHTLKNWTELIYPATDEPLP